MPDQNLLQHVFSGLWFAGSAFATWFLLGRNVRSLPPEHAEGGQVLTMDRMAILAAGIWGAVLGPRVTGPHTCSSAWGALGLGSLVFGLAVVSAPVLVGAADLLADALRGRSELPPARSAAAVFLAGPILGLLGLALLGWVVVPAGAAAGLLLFGLSGLWEAL